MFYLPHSKKPKFQEQYSSNFVKLFNKAVQKSYLIQLKNSIKKTDEKKNSPKSKEVSHSFTPKKLIYDRRKLVNNALRDTEFKKIDNSANFLSRKCKTDSNSQQINRKKQLFIKVSHKTEQAQNSQITKSKRQHSLPPLVTSNRQLTKSHIMETLKYWDDLQQKYFSRQKLSQPLAINKNPISERIEKNKIIYANQMRRNRNLQISLNEMKNQNEKIKQNYKIKNKKIKNLVKSSTQKQRPINKNSILDKYFEPWEIQSKQQQQGKQFL